MIWVAQHGHISTYEKTSELTSFERLCQKLKNPVISLQKKKKKSHLKHMGYIHIAQRSVM